MRIKQRRNWAGGVIAVATMVAATLAVAPAANAAPLFTSTVTTYGVGFQMPTDMQVVAVAQVSPVVVAGLTQPTVRFDIGWSGSEQLTKTVPVGGPCAPCATSTDFRIKPDCDPSAPPIWIRATYSGERLGPPPLNIEITPPSTSELSWMSHCPTYTWS